MPSSIIRFSDEQFNRVVNAFNKGTPSKFSLDRYFKLIQLLAILAAGIWTIYTYVTFQRGQQVLSLQQQGMSTEQQRLALEQNKLLADTRRSAEEVSLKQQEFDLAQKRVLAGTQKNAAEASLKQQEFTLAQNRLLAGTQSELAKTSLAQQRLSLDQQKMTSDFEVRKAESEAQIRGLQAQAAAQSPIKYEVRGGLEKLRADGSGMGEYKLQISVEAQNLSERPIEVSGATVEIYVGDFKAGRE